MRVIRDAFLRSLAIPYFMAAAFVYVVSFTNPFLTNPIGMAVVMIAMVAVRVIGCSDDARRSAPAPVPGEPVGAIRHHSGSGSVPISPVSVEEKVCQ